LVRNGVTPPPEYAPRKCGACSLLDLCLPRQGLTNRRARAYVDRLYQAPEDGEIAE
jgi:hypothetical protein